MGQSVPVDSIVPLFSSESRLEDQAGYYSDLFSHVNTNRFAALGLAIYDIAGTGYMSSVVEGTACGMLRC